MMNLINFLADPVTCGEVEIGGEIVNIIRVVYNGIKIGVPIILIVVGMIGMGKAIASQKEDDIKKAQNTLIKQAIAAVIVFLMFQLVQIVMSVIGVKDNDNWSCVKEILTGEKTTEKKDTDKSKATSKEKCDEAEGRWFYAQCNGERWDGAQSDCVGIYAPGYCE